MNSEVIFDVRVRAKMVETLNKLIDKLKNLGHKRIIMCTGKIENMEELFDICDEYTRLDIEIEDKISELKTFDEELDKF